MRKPLTMTKSIRLISLMVITLLSACDKEDTELFYTNTKGLLFQVKFDSEVFYEFTYNGLNQVVEEKSKYHYTKHNYQNGNLISSDYYLDPRLYSSSSLMLDSAMNRIEWVNPTNTEKSSTKTYIYDLDGKILRSENYLGISEFTYDDKDRIRRQTFFRDNKRRGYIDYFYDNNDNLIQKLHYLILANGDSELQTRTEYEFDNKMNPYAGFNSLIIPGRYTNTNNIIKETYTIYFEVDASVDTKQIIENSYKYNSLGFPISKNDSETYLYY